MAAKKVSKKVTSRAPSSPKKTAPSSVASQVYALASKAIQKTTSKTPIALSRKPLPCVPTGSISLDNLIGGNLSPDKTGPICPGYPRGHITEIFGAEASGKTTLALEAIVEVQKQGGTAMFLDYEHALHHGYAAAIGVDFSNLLFYQPDNMEEGLEMLRIGVAAGADLIVVDSVAAMVPQADMEKKFNESDQLGNRARKLASALPKVVKLLRTPSERNPNGAAAILINQTRATISTGPSYAKGSSINTAGGFALKFFAYLRLHATGIRTERVKQKDPVTKKEKNIPYGTCTQVKVIKSKVDAKQGQTTELFIRFGQGIDDYHTIIESAEAHKVIKRSGAFYLLGEHKFQGREKLRNWLIDNPSEFEKLQAEVLKYIRAQGVLVEEEDDQALEIDDIIAQAEGAEDEDEDSYQEAEEVLIEGSEA